MQQNQARPSVSKLTLDEAREALAAGAVMKVLSGILMAKGCSPAEAEEVAQHLLETDTGGMESHGVMRVLQYAEQYDTGYLRPAACRRLVVEPNGLEWVDGGGGIGIPTMRMAVERVCDIALDRGLGVISVRNVGHTGRLGAYAEAAGHKNCFLMIVGGGGRQNWRQVAPFGGRSAVLPTNPYCFGIPGGRRGPVVVDFATSVVAGGWVHAARAAGALLPEGALIDRDGLPSRNPQAYFEGGAILPKGGAMGYGLAVMAEMLCDAMLGPATTEVNWLVVALDTTRYRDPDAMQSAAEDILSELRDCPPASGFKKVEVPGERERDIRAGSSGSIVTLPATTWKSIKALAARLDVAIPEEVAAPAETQGSSAI
jgi:LDH2 family malate/lactate/ureidoglycolate dehydrogenase